MSYDIYNKLDLLEEALRNRSKDTVIFVDTDEKKYELSNVSYNKQIDWNGVVQTVILLEVRQLSKRFKGLSIDLEGNVNLINDGLLMMGTVNELEDLLNELDMKNKRLQEKYTDEHSNCETLRCEVQRLENENEQLKQRTYTQSVDRELLCKRIDEVKKENEQLKSDYTQLQEEWISSDKEVERLKEELRLALNQGN